MYLCNCCYPLGIHRAVSTVTGLSLILAQNDQIRRDTWLAACGHGIKDANKSAVQTVFLLLGEICWDSGLGDRTPAPALRLGSLLPPPAA